MVGKVACISHLDTSPAQPCGMHACMCVHCHCTQVGPTMWDTHHHARIQLFFGGAHTHPTRPSIQASGSCPPFLFTSTPLAERLVPRTSLRLSAPPSPSVFPTFPKDPEKGRKKKGLTHRQGHGFPCPITWANTRNRYEAHGGLPNGSAKANAHTHNPVGISLEAESRIARHILPRVLHTTRPSTPLGAFGA
jgi:hypothetical protein